MMGLIQLNQVTALLLPRSLGTSLTLPLEMLTAAASMLRSQRQAPHLTLKLASPDGQSVTLTGGARMEADTAIDDVQQTDLIIVPGLWRSPKPIISEHPQIIRWLQEQYQQGAAIVAAGAGVYLPASAGLLDNLPATTHWFLFDRFQRDFPQIRLKTDHLITEANRIYCAGSVNSIADLFVHLIGKAWGEAIAQRVEQQFSYEIRRPYQSVSFTENSALHQDEVIIEIQQWIQQHLNEELTAEKLASRAQMSQRSFSRRFRNATDMAPTHYIQLLRIQLARELLRDTNLNISAIAEQVGYPDIAYFCRLFKRHCSLSPTHFRRSVRGKLFSLQD